MKALTFQGEGDVKVIDVPKPSIKGSGDALIKVTLGAVCGSDLHILHGHTPDEPGRRARPRVRRRDRGGRRRGQALQARRPCRGQLLHLVRPLRAVPQGLVQPVRRQGARSATASTSATSAAARRSTSSCPTPTTRWSRYPTAMSDEQAIFVGDILSTGFFGAERAEIKPGDVVAIVGAGPVGLMATMCAQLFGPVAHVRRRHGRLAAGDGPGAGRHPDQRLAGAPGGGDPGRTPAGIGADSSIECVGLLSAVDTAIQSVRGGGTISMVGVPERGARRLSLHAGCG